MHASARGTSLTSQSLRKMSVDWTKRSYGPIPREAEFDPKRTPRLISSDRRTAAFRERSGDSHIAVDLDVGVDGEALRRRTRDWTVRNDDDALGTISTYTIYIPAADAIGRRASHWVCML